MSTVPGDDAWRDPDLVPVDPEEPLRLGDSTARGADPEEYEPDFARADQEDRANEADVAEQDSEVPDDDGADG
jgi:hypothetical protein